MCSFLIHLEFIFMDIVRWDLAQLFFSQKGRCYTNTLSFILIIIEKKLQYTERQISPDFVFYSFPFSWLALRIFFRWLLEFTYENVMGGRPKEAVGSPVA